MCIRDRLRVTVFPNRLARGKYVGQIQLSATGASTITVPVTLTVSRRETDDHTISATTYTYDPANTGAVSSEWVYGAGMPFTDSNDPTNQGLVLSNNAGATSGARAGVIIEDVAGATLSVLGFDLREGSLCSAKGPRFVVVTSDNVVHTVGSCKDANLQAAPASGWKRFQFDPSQATPAITPDMTVQSIALMVDDGPSANGGMVVIDNININGTFIGHD